MGGFIVNIFRFLLSEDYRLEYSKKFSESLVSEQDSQEAAYSEIQKSNKA